MFHALPASVQGRFKVVDAKVKTTGDLSAFDRQGWAYFIDIDDTHTAMGSHKEQDKLFYWLLIGPSEIMPVIL
jgi:hypothetical protein